MRKKKILLTKEVIYNQINTIKQYYFNFIPEEIINNFIFEKNDIVIEQKIIIQQAVQYKISYKFQDSTICLESFIFILNNKYIKDITEDNLLQSVIKFFYCRFSLLRDTEQIFVLNNILLVNETVTNSFFERLKKQCIGKAISKINSLILLYEL